MREASTGVSAVERIAGLYKIGCESLELTAESRTLGETKREAERLGISVGRLYAARQFAQTYNDKQFDALRTLLGAHPGAPFTESHLRILLPIKLQERVGLQRICIEQKWSATRLAQEVRRQFGRRDGRGGRPKPHTSRDELILVVQFKRLELCRWFDLAVKGSPAFHRLSKRFQKDLVKAIDAFRALVMR